jgi:hypothetical protein
VSHHNTLDVEIIPQKIDSIENGDYMFGLSYSTEIQEPARNNKSILRLEAADISTEHFHQISIFVENLSMENQGLLACVINMQTGTSISQNELERLKRREYFDFYEVRKDGSEIVVYWRGIEGAGKKEFKIWYQENFEVRDPNPILVEAFLCYDKKGSRVQQMLSFL